MSRPPILGSGGFVPRGLDGGAATPAPPKRTPDSLMPHDEWKRTAAVRRETIASMGHLAWSKLTVEQADEAVRREAASRGL